MITWIRSRSLGEDVNSLHTQVRGGEEPQRSQAKTFQANIHSRIDLAEQHEIDVTLSLISSPVSPFEIKIGL